MNLNLGYINKVVAVSVNFDGDRTVLHFQKLKKKKGEIEFEKGKILIDSIPELIKQIGKQTPIVLHFTGKGVLNRSVKNAENYRHSLLMNANLNDFYFTDFVQEYEVFSSVIRKDVVKDVLESFKKQGTEVISFSSGPFITAPIVQYISKSHIDVNGLRLFFEKNVLKTFSKTDESTMSADLGGQLIRHDQLGAVATATQCFNPSKQIVLPEEEEVFENNFQEAEQKNVFIRFGYALIVLFLTVLTANYFYLGHLNSTIEGNQLELLEFEDQLGQLSFLEDEKSRKEKLLNSSGLLNRKFLSYYLMSISNSVPKEIALTTVVVRPLVKEIKKRHKIEFHNQIVQVTGQSKSSEMLSRWIDTLKEEEWLSRVDILDYSYAKNIGNFELEIAVF